MEENRIKIYKTNNVYVIVRMCDSTELVRLIAVLSPSELSRVELSWIEVTTTIWWCWTRLKVVRFTS